MRRFAYVGGIWTSVPCDCVSCLINFMSDWKSKGDDKVSQRTPRPDEPGFDGCDDPLILVEDGPQLADAFG